MVTATASTSPRRAPPRRAGLLDGRVEQVDVGPRGDLGHDPAVAACRVCWSASTLADQAAVGDQGDAGLVAGGLDPEHQHRYSSRGSGMRAARPARRSA